ncbi:HD-GYP domain-containing protein [Chloroflexota bacterium]
MTKYTLKGMIQSLSGAIESRGSYTYGHKNRVAKIAMAIAEKLGLPQAEIDDIITASILHDIGNINVPLEILNKPGKLNEYEFNLVKAHVKTSYNIVKHIKYDSPVATIILQHHERLDGSGYPSGIPGNSIIKQARIIAVADVVEAICSLRPYRPSLGVVIALEEIRKNKGILYDEEVVDACCELIEKDNFKL